MDTSYRDYLGTLNINLKVLASKLDTVLENPKLEHDLQSLASRDYVYHLESMVMLMVDKIIEARKRDYRLQLWPPRRQNSV